MRACLPLSGAHDPSCALLLPLARDAIVTRGLTKRYGDRCVVDNLDFTVPTGQVCGFVGPNGSGKTTTIRMLLGLVAPSQGTAEILGHPLERPQDYLPRWVP